MDKREQLIEKFTERGMDRSMTEGIVAELTDEQVEETLASLDRTDAEREELRNRLRSDRVLMQAVCPRDDWKDEDARFDVARRAVKIIDATAEKNDCTATELAQALIDGQGTIADTIATHGTDPRNDSFGTGNFYAFRWRIKDAVEVVKASEIEAARQAERSRQDAAWAAKGLERCDRCDGQGGRKEWPGFTCFKCGGTGAL